MLEEWIRNKGDNKVNRAEEWKKKGMYFLVILCCAGILALIWPVSSTDTQTDSSSISEPVYKKKEIDNVKAEMANELESILSQIEGAGKVSVSLTLSSDGINTYAANVREEKRNQEETSKGSKKVTNETNISRDVAVNSGNALLIEHKNPEVIGVLIVADGAGNPEVRENLTYAASTLLDIPAHKVRVMPRERRSN
ncbi:hypothetical protein [Thermosyntropha sp.]|uniref:hypothetical protein n=1 Tax=Thermosyntropha sp. TaxID=2740820 RepID=UPI0025E9A2E7|nr:hypothetical protein [Thermosyntropha sp.]MBO8159204.1 hypothetical protein [Thermosyntropha sp.]